MTKCVLNWLRFRHYALAFFCFFIHEEKRRNEEDRKNEQQQIFVFQARAADRRGKTSEKRFAWMFMLLGKAENIFELLVARGLWARFSGKNENLKPKTCWPSWLNGWRERKLFVSSLTRNFFLPSNEDCANQFALPLNNSQFRRPH